MGGAESKFRQKVEDHNNKHKNDLCECGQKLYKECILEYSKSSRVDDDIIKCNVLKKQHCEVCHIDSNSSSYDHSIGNFNDGFEKLLSFRHCCKCKMVIKQNINHCKECHVTYSGKKKHCCKCNRFYDRENESHCCQCNCVWQGRENHCCKCKLVYRGNHCCECKMVFKDYHCCKCKVAWSASHKCLQSE